MAQQWPPMLPMKAPKMEAAAMLPTPYAITPLGLPPLNRSPYPMGTMVPTMLHPLKVTRVWRYPRTPRLL
jgi:hypothetical protein